MTTYISIELQANWLRVNSSERKLGYSNIREKEKMLQSELNIYTNE
jgi:hypothetical protein